MIYSLDTDVINFRFCCQIVDVFVNSMENWISRFFMFNESLFTASQS